MTLSPEARQRAREIAEAAPPFPPEVKEKIRAILWAGYQPGSQEEDET